MVAGASWSVEGPILISWGPLGSTGGALGFSGQPARTNDDCCLGLNSGHRSVSMQQCDQSANLAVDAAGYSRLMSVDEEGALAALNARAMTMVE